MLWFNFYRGLNFINYSLSYITVPKPKENRHLGCKESQFYSLPFGQAVASMYYAYKSFSLAPKPFLMSRIDYNPSVI